MVDRIRDMLSPCAVAAFTSGRKTASARFRVRQYVAALRNYGVQLTEFKPRLGSYPPEKRALRPVWAAASLSERVLPIAKSYQFDVTLLQREMLSTFATLERFTARPRVLDVDDAIWVYRGGAAAERLSRLCDLVICGNSFLAAKFSGWNEAVAVIPTAVDTNRFRPSLVGQRAEVLVGWSGGSNAFCELYAIESAIAEALRANRSAKFLVMSDAPPKFRLISPDRVEFVRWSEEVEVGTLQRMDVGLMPLCDSEWNRGKCAYKLLLYMACGAATVATPVGVNAEVLEMDDCGLSARGEPEWFRAIDRLIKDHELRSRLGASGRILVQRAFSVEHVVPAIADRLRSVAALRSPSHGNPLRKRNHAPLNASKQ